MEAGCGGDVLAEEVVEGCDGCVLAVAAVSYVDFLAAVRQVSVRVRPDRPSLCCDRVRIRLVLLA